MDDRELSKLFYDAARNPPPASFDRDDVLGASRRATARRRNALAGGSLLGVAVLGAGLVLGAQLPPAAQPGEPAGQPPGAAPAPEPSGRAVPQPMSAPRTAGPGTCGPADPVLAAELTDALAGSPASPSGPAVPLSEACPLGSRAAGVPVAGGTLYLLVSPGDAGAGERGSARPDGARGYSVPASDGRLVSVLSVPEVPQQSAPLAEHLDDLAREVARQL